MNDLTLTGGSPFDSIKRVREDGSEYWDARELQPNMDYGKWENFAAVIEKAKASLALVEGRESAEHHFLVAGSDGGRWGNQQLDNYELTRFGAYLTAMAGDDTKLAVAKARIYFAIRTREAEVTPVVSALPDISTASGVLAMAEQFAATARQLVAVEAKLSEQAPLVAQAEAHRAGTRDITRQEFAREVVKWSQEVHELKVLQRHVFAFLDHLGLFIKPGRSDSGQATQEAFRRGLADTDKGTTERGRNYATGKLTPKGQGFAWDRVSAYIEANGTLELPRRIGEAS